MIAGGRDMTLSALVAEIDSARQHGNLSSAIRLYVLDFYAIRFQSTRSAVERDSCWPAPQSRLQSKGTRTAAASCATTNPTSRRRLHGRNVYKQISRAARKNIVRMSSVAGTGLMNLVNLARPSVRVRVGVIVMSDPPANRRSYERHGDTPDLREQSESKHSKYERHARECLDLVRMTADA